MSKKGYVIFFKTSKSKHCKCLNPAVGLQHFISRKSSLATTTPLFALMTKHFRVMLLNYESLSSEVKEADL